MYDASIDVIARIRRCFDIESATGIPFRPNNQSTRSQSRAFENTIQRSWLYLLLGTNCNLRQIEEKNSFSPFLVQIAEGNSNLYCLFGFWPRLLETTLEGSMFRTMESTAEAKFFKTALMNSERYLRFQKIFFQTSSNEGNK